MTINHTKLHRWLKWLWIFPGIPISYVLREMIAYLTFLSVYAIITGHWSAEEAADDADEPDGDESET